MTRFRCVLILACLILSPSFSAWAEEAEQKPPRSLSGRELLRMVVRVLEPTAEQQKALLALVRNHRSDLDSPAFAQGVQALLTEAQKKRLQEQLTAGISAPTRTESDGTRVWTDLAYRRLPQVPPGLLSLDVYAPGAARNLPVLLFVHGGGWQKGDKRSAEAKGRFFTSKGYVLVSVNYRLSPLVRHPAHIEDVIRSIAWVRRNISHYGGDEKRLFLMGHSAGAHLAALAALDAGRLKTAGLNRSMIRGVILLDGAGYDIPLQINTLGGLRSRALYRVPFGVDPAGWKDASPVTHARKGKGIAPFLIFHVASREASRMQSENLAKAIRGSEGRASVVPAHGKTHGTINRDIGKRGDPVTAQILRFLANPKPEGEKTQKAADK